MSRNGGTHSAGGIAHQTCFFGSVIYEDQSNSATPRDTVTPGACGSELESRKRYLFSIVLLRFSIPPNALRGLASVGNDDVQHVSHYVR